MNCIELNDFLHTITLNWIHRYLSLNYNDFWTSLLDRLHRVNPATRLIILEWGSEELNNPLIRCNIHFLKPILKSMKLLYENFQTPPDTGNNRFIYQPVFRNINLQIKWSLAVGGVVLKEPTTVCLACLRLPGFTVTIKNTTLSQC